MRISSSNKRAALGAILLVVGVTGVLVFLPLAEGQGPPGPPPQQGMSITEVSLYSPTSELLSIVGENLDNGPQLDVTLGEFPGSLMVVSATSTEIVAGLPDPLPPGDYLLTVSTGDGPNRQATYDLTVDGIPSGAIILWDRSSTCPAGFTRLSSLDGRFLVAHDTPGVMGGSESHSHGAGTLTSAPHRHALEPWEPQKHQPVDDNAAGTDFNAVTGPASAEPMDGTTEPADSRPPFVTLILCRRS